MNPRNGRNERGGQSGIGRQPGAGAEVPGSATGAHAPDNPRDVRQALGDTSPGGFDDMTADDDLGAGMPTPSMGDVRSDRSDDEARERR